MSSSFYILKHRSVMCPLWKDEVTISAKYRYIDDAENPYLARFSGAKCEVLENIRLPEYKKDKRLALYRFCRLSHECPYLHEFPELIDTRH